MIQSENSAIAIVAILLISSVSLVIFLNDDDNNKIPLGLEDYGSAPNFTLSGTDGENVTFSDYSGKVRMVTFIYTACTQGCSINTLKMMNMLKSLNQEHQEKLEFFVIDFDYMHDNLTTLQHYSETLSGEDGVPSNMNFVWGIKDQMNQTAEDWKFDFELVSSPMMNMSTSMEMNDTTTTNTDNMHMGHEVVWIHAFVIYLIDQNDVLRKKIWGLEWDQNQVEGLVEKLL